jgi:hypothetical protein
MLLRTVLALSLILPSSALAQGLVECVTEQVLGAKDGKYIQRSEDRPMLGKRIFFDERTQSLNQWGTAIPESRVTILQSGRFSGEIARQAPWVIRLGIESSHFQAQTLVIEPWDKSFTLFDHRGSLVAGKCKVVS